MLFSDDGSAFEPNATLDDVYNCFRLLLGRHPSRREWLGHAGFAGQPLERVAATYVNSLEFFNRGLLQARPQSFELVQLDGFCLYASPGDVAVGRDILGTGHYEPNVSRVFRRVVSLGMNVVDIGANIGFYTMLAASLAGPDGRVWAVEPNPDNVRMILASCARNHFPNVQVIQAAAGDRCQSMCLFRSGSNGTVGPVSVDHPSQIPEPVLVLPLDAILADSRVDVVKIDVEGAEGRALRGMTGVLQRDRPIIFCEFTPGAMPGMSGMTGQQYLTLLLDLGYHLSVLLETPVDCGRDIGRVMDCFQATGFPHVDLFAEP